MARLIFALWGLILALGTSAAVAQDNYKLRPGDTVTIEVLEDSQLNRSVLVLPDGTINFPFAGTVQAGGRSAGQLQGAIRDGIASNFAAPPTVFVTVSSVQPVVPTAPTGAVGKSTIDVYFTGEVGSPGLRPLTRGTTMLQALAQSGGFTQFAATKRIQLRRTDSRGSSRVYTFNYRALSDGAVMKNNLVLEDGDVILVPERRLFE